MSRRASHPFCPFLSHPSHRIFPPRITVSSSLQLCEQGVSGAQLYAVEVQLDEALSEFKRLVGGLGEGAQVGGNTIGIELSDFADVLDAVPPGVDELVALAKVVSLAKKESLGVKFERVIIDTAPTGHTLRLLSFPDFLDRFITRALALRQRFAGATAFMGGASSILGKVFGGGNAPPPAADAPEPGAIQKLKEFQGEMQELEALLHDPEQSEFVIVTIPTALAMVESERLAEALSEEGVMCERGVVNRLISEGAEAAYLDRLSKGQQVCLGEMEDLASRCDVHLTEVPLFDTELRAVYGLRAMGSVLFSGE